MVPVNPAQFGPTEPAEEPLKKKQDVEHEAAADIISDVTAFQ